MEAAVVDDTAPEIIAQMIFVILLAALMFALGLLFHAPSRRKRERRAAREAAPVLDF